MSCSACNRSPCACDCVGPTLEILEPSGSQGGQSLDPVCEDCDIPTTDCCNQFNFHSEAAGNSFVLSIGGVPDLPAPDTTFVSPFQLPNPTAPECFVCCDLLTPREIPGIGMKACMPEPLPPGTYQIFARATLFSVANPAPALVTAGAIGGGAKLSIRWFEDCNNLINPLGVLDFLQPCSCCPLPVPPGTPLVPSLVVAVPQSAAVFPLPAAFLPFQVVHPVGQAMVFSPGCRPAFQILGVNGCSGPTSLAPVGDLFIANIQIVMMFLSARDLVGCGGFPLASVTPFESPDGCPFLP